MILAYLSTKRNHISSRNSYKWFISVVCVCNKLFNSISTWTVNGWPTTWVIIIVLICRWTMSTFGLNSLNHTMMIYLLWIISTDISSTLFYRSQALWLLVIVYLGVQLLPQCVISCLCVYTADEFLTGMLKWSATETDARAVGTAPINPARAATPAADGAWFFFNRSCAALIVQNVHTSLATGGPELHSPSTRGGSRAQETHRS